jgi:TIR domain
MSSEYHTHMSSIFLAHSSADKQFTRKLAHTLRERGVVVWIDEAEIKVGDSLFAKIGAGITDMAYLGVVLSPRSAKSDWVKREVEIALTKEMNGRKVVVLPILYKQCDIPPFLQSKLYADFSLPSRFDTGLEVLLARLLELEDDHILRKQWQEKTVRYGLKVKLLTASSRGPMFTPNLRRAVTRMAAKYLRGELATADHLGEVVLHAVGSVLANKQVPLTLQELSFLTDELTLHTVKLAADLARRSKILIPAEKGSRVDPSLEKALFDEVAATFALPVGTIDGARRVFNSTLNELVLSRIAITAPVDRDLSPVVSAYLFDSLYKKAVDDLKSIAWETKPAKLRRSGHHKKPGDPQRTRKASSAPK